jgi:hypothetical protein
MPSRRSRFETACRIGAFGVLGWLLGGSIVAPATPRLERVTAASLGPDLVALTRAPANVAVHVDVPAVPDPWIVDWLGAARRGGRAVSWSGAPAPAALVAQPMLDPEGGVRIDVAAPSGSVVMLRDDVSPIDSVRVARMGGSVATPLVVGDVHASVDGELLTARAGDTPPVRSIVVIGAAGWEAKFVASALEERGWPVVARFSVAPNADVAQGVLSPLDTSRVAAVIAIDSTVAPLAPMLERFVRSGGGLVLAGSASAPATVARLAVGRPGVRTRPPTRAPDTVRLGSTGFYPVTSVTDDAVVLERRADGVVMAARRVGAGRVVQVGYDDSWRWRMAGAPGAEAAHRAWWSRVVSSVAYEPSVVRDNGTAMGRSRPGRSGFVAALGPTGAAPVAHLTASHGPPRPEAPRMPARSIDRRILLMLIIVLLLSEWASRRLRGVK